MLSERVAVDEQINRKADAQDADGKTSDDDDGVDGADLFRDAVNFMFLRGPETGEMFFNGGVDDVLVFELEGEPAAVKFIFPLFRQARQNLGGRRLKIETFPKGRAFLRPDTEDTVIGGEGLDAFPEEVPGGISNAEIGVTFAVEQGMLFDDLDAHRAQHLAFGIFDDLKFGQARLEFIRGQAHGSPK